MNQGGTRASGEGSIVIDLPEGLQDGASPASASPSAGVVPPSSKP